MIKKLPTRTRISFMTPKVKTPNLIKETKKTPLKDISKGIEKNHTFLLKKKSIFERRTR